MRASSTRACPLEGEYYWRWLSNFAGVNTGGIANINDNGYQLQASAMVVPKASSAVLRRLADLRRTTATQWEVRGGENWY